MPRIVGIVERFGHTLYSGWIADTRPGGMGVSHETSFSDPMRLYVSDIGDRLRTNMYVPGRLPGEQSASILQMGFHVSFNTEARYQEFFDTQNGSSFVLNINGDEAYKLEASKFQDTNKRVTPRPTYKYGIRIQHNISKPLVIAPLQTFHVTLNTEPEFANTMKNIDSGRWTTYAEIKHFMNVLMTREVL